MRHADYRINCPGCTIRGYLHPALQFAAARITAQVASSAFTTQLQQQEAVIKSFCDMAAKSVRERVAAAAVGQGLPTRATLASSSLLFEAAVAARLQDVARLVDVRKQASQRVQDADENIRHCELEVQKCEEQLSSVREKLRALDDLQLPSLFDNAADGGVSNDEHKRAAQAAQAAVIALECSMQRQLQSLSVAGRTETELLAAAKAALSQVERDAEHAQQVLASTEAEAGSCNLNMSLLFDALDYLSEASLQRVDLAVSRERERLGTGLATKDGVIDAQRQEIVRLTAQHKS